MNFLFGLQYEDVEFFYKLIPNINKFAFVERGTNLLCSKEKNSIANKQDYRTGHIFNVLQNVIDFYKKFDLYDDYKDEIEYTYTRLLLCSSLKRIKKIGDNVAREKLIYETWQNVNTKFPNWKKNKYLKKNSFKEYLYEKYKQIYI